MFEIKHFPKSPPRFADNTSWQKIPFPFESSGVDNQYQSSNETL
jgi:hypothetical protein